MTVLVVDDLHHVRRMIRFSLHGRGHRVVEAGDGVEAWRLLTTERPDLVIMDISMPGPSGLDVCRSIRAAPELEGLPVLLLTAGGAAWETRALEAGASGFMTKPFSPSALLDLVDTLSTA
jgi:CheY-like chemotaxis protein